MSFAAMLLVGVLVDLFIGWPGAFYRAIGHPVTWLGHLITVCDTHLNTGERHQQLLAGAATVVICIVTVGLPALVVQSLLPNNLTGIVLGGLLAWPLIAVRSMHDHVAAVARPLVAGELTQARNAVSMIVGRDPEGLDAVGTSRAAIESLAENTSDGIVAPVFWGVVAGLPGIAIYKALNTLDSMIGHKSARYEAFGKVAARLDDVVNWIPARLTGLMFALVSATRFQQAIRVMMRDAAAHRSPNAGWPEGAMAGALDVRLSGPRTYGTQTVQEPWMNAEAPDPKPKDLHRALMIFRRAIALMVLALAAAALF